MSINRVLKRHHFLIMLIDKALCRETQRFSLPDSYRYRNFAKRD
jgi:hypothetical protein